MSVASHARSELVHEHARVAAHEDHDAEVALARAVDEHRTLDVPLEYPRRVARARRHQRLRARDVRGDGRVEERDALAAVALGRFQDPAAAAARGVGVGVGEEPSRQSSSLLGADVLIIILVRLLVVAVAVVVAVDDVRLRRRRRDRRRVEPDALGVASHQRREVRLPRQRGLQHESVRDARRGVVVAAPAEDAVPSHVARFRPVQRRARRVVHDLPSAAREGVAQERRLVRRARLERDDAATHLATGPTRRSRLVPVSSAARARDKWPRNVHPARRFQVFDAFQLTANLDPGDSCAF
jgi:hypothetical protein